MKTTKRRFKRRPCPHCGRMMGKMFPHQDICPANPDVARRVRKLFQEFGVAPTITQYDEAARGHPSLMPSSQLLVRHWGPWREIVAMMVSEGVVKERPKRSGTDWDHVRAEIVRLSRELYGGAYRGEIAPTATDITRNSDISMATLYRYPHGGFDGLIRSIKDRMGIELVRPGRDVYNAIRARWAERHTKREDLGPSPREVAEREEMERGLPVLRTYERVRPDGRKEQVSVLR